MKKAKAAVLLAPRQVEIQEFPLPEISDEDGLLRIEYTGVCGGDVPPFIGEMMADIWKLPLILGHEIVGRVERIGKNAAERWGVKEGDRIIVEEHIPCGRCDLCHADRSRMCVKHRYGWQSINEAPSLWGGYSDYVYLHPNAVVWKVAEHVPVELVPLFIPISNGIYWVQTRGKARVGGTVLIQGPGQHGLGCVIGANECGAGTIIVTGLSQDKHRLQLARDLGATHTIIADKENVVERVKEITNGRMADVVLDVTDHSAEPVAMALDLVALDGTVVLAGFKHSNPIDNFLSDKLLFREATVTGVLGRDTPSVRAAIDLIASEKYPLRGLCTHTFSIEQTEEALQTVAREVNLDAIHVSVSPDFA